MLVSADAMNTCLDILQPLLKGEESKGIATVVIGTVLGECSRYRQEHRCLDAGGSRFPGDRPGSGCIS